MLNALAAAWLLVLILVPHTTVAGGQPAPRLSATGRLWEEPPVSLAKVDSPGFTLGHPYAAEARQTEAARCRDPGGRCTWEHTYGGVLEDKLYDLAVTRDDGVILVGNSRSLGAGDYDAVMLRLDRRGEIQWLQRLGGRAIDQVYGVALDSNGGFVVAGQTRSKGSGRGDVWVARIDQQGGVSWERTFGGAEEDRGRSVAATQDGGSVVVGFTDSSQHEDVDAIVLRLDKDGNLLWKKVFGREGHDGFFDVAVLNDGSIAAVGHSERIGSRGYDFWVVHMEGDGELRWQKTFSRGRLAAATAVIPSPGNGILAVGVTSADSFRQDDAWILRLDNDGNLIWQKVVGGSGQDKAWAVGRQPSGRVIIAIATTSVGEGSTDAQLVCLDDDGKHLWERVYGGRLWDRPTSLGIGASGQILLGGYTTTTGAGFEDYWVLRLDSEGRR